MHPGIYGERRPRSACLSAQSGKNRLSANQIWIQCMTREQREQWLILYVHDDQNLQIFSWFKCTFFALCDTICDGHSISFQAVKHSNFTLICKTGPLKRMIQWGTVKPRLEQSKCSTKVRTIKKLHQSFTDIVVKEDNTFYCKFEKFYLAGICFCLVFAVGNWSHSGQIKCIYQANTWCCVDC